MTEHSKETPRDFSHAEAAVTNERLAATLRDLRLRLQKTTDPALASTKDRFEKIYEKLPEVARTVITRYKEVCKKHDLDPGTVFLFMVGGRVKGKPLVEDSDIDLIFGVENFRQSPERHHFERFSDALDAMSLKIKLMKEIRAIVADICRQMEIPNEFHILSYGSPVDVDMSTVRPGDSLSEGALLLARE